MPAPSAAGCDSSRMPLPLTVVSTGMPYSARARISSTAPRAPPPATISGRREPSTRPAISSARARPGPIGSGSGRTGAGRRDPLPLQHVDRHLEVDRSRAGGRELLEHGGQDLGDLVRRLDPDAAGGDGVEGGLLVLDLVQPADVGADLAARRPGRDGQHRDGVGVRRRERGDRVGDARTGRRDDHAGPAADAGVPVRGVPRTLLVPGDDVPDPGRRQVAVELEVVRAGDAEDDLDTVRGECVDDGRAAGDPLSHGSPASWWPSR